LTLFVKVNLHKSRLKVNFNEPLQTLITIGTEVIAEVTHNGVEIYFPKDYMNQYHRYPIKNIVSKIIF
jgi:hypothetical protein